MSIENNTTYQGWTNYETWNWMLWLDNDQGSQDYWNERAIEVLTESSSFTDSVDTLIDYLQDEMIACN